MRRRAPLLAVIAIFATAARTPAADDIPSPSQCHAAGNSAVRSRSPLASAVMEYGIKHSPTLRALIASLQPTDVVAYVDSDLRPLGDVWGHVAFISKTPLCRYVRIAITAQLNLTQAAALLAHELQHAFEIASHPEVIDDASLSEVYLRIGHRGRFANAYDSVEAVAMGARVAAEIYGFAATPSVTPPSARSSPAETER